MNTSTGKMPEYFGKDLEAMSFAVNYHKWILAEFYPYLGNRVAEVGAGTGTFSRLLLETQIGHLSAFEPSLNMYPLLEEALCEDQRGVAINSFFAGNSDAEGFDSILYLNVLEHIEDDLSEIANAHAALKQNGHLLIFVPALPWLYSELDKQVGHFRRYVKRELVKITRKQGFKIIKARYFDIAGILPWYVNFVLLRNSIDSGSVSLYDRVVVPLARPLERVLPPPIGKNVLLVAQKA
ncbi:MAG: class I SAM-dependent methyltransferase [Candidatus Thiodiazotropha sp. (ex Ctena orbiculata)]|nr:class I SAM-dependent methyltransferase [Candidatus Thiodiazotropha taylori]